MTRRRSDDRGSGTIWMLNLVLGSLAMALLVLTGGVLASTRHRAASAADFVALAAAEAAAQGAASSVACEQASRVASESAVTLVACQVNPAGACDVRVRAQVRVPMVGLFAAEVQARAGPASSPAQQPSPAAQPSSSAQPLSPTAR